MGIQRNINVINYILRIAFLLLFAQHFDREINPKKNIILDTLAYTVLIGSVNVEIATRMYEFYAIGLYASMAMFLRYFNRRSKGVALIFFVLAMLILLCRYVSIFDGGSFREYRLFWEI